MVLTWDQDPQELYPRIQIADTVQRLIDDTLTVHTEEPRAHEQDFPEHNIHALASEGLLGMKTPPRVRRPGSRHAERHLRRRTDRAHRPRHGVRPAAAHAHGQSHRQSRDRVPEAQISAAHLPPNAGRVRVVGKRRRRRQKRPQHQSLSRKRLLAPQRPKGVLHRGRTRGRLYGDDRHHRGQRLLPGVRR